LLQVTLPPVCLWFVRKKKKPFHHMLRSKQKFSLYFLQGLKLQLKN
jgi:hypothetical protein